MKINHSVVYCLLALNCCYMAVRVGGGSNAAAELGLLNRSGQR